MSNSSNQDIAHPPTRRDQLLDRSFRWVTRLFGWLTLSLCAAVGLLVAWQALPAIRKFGLSFVTGTSWDPGKQKYGILRRSTAPW
jgi:phosphate transport system permease protein